MRTPDFFTLWQHTDIQKTKSSACSMRVWNCFEDSEKLQLGTTHFKSLFLEQRQWVPNIILETLYDSQQVVLDCYMSHSPGVK